MKQGALLVGVLAVAGLGLLALPCEREAPRSRLVITPGPAQTPMQDLRRVPSTWPKPALAASAPVTPQPMSGSGGVVLSGHLDDAQVRELHTRLNWDGGADPGIWATPADFSQVD